MPMTLLAMDPDKMSERELRGEVNAMRAHLNRSDQEFIYTVTGRKKPTQMCYRDPMPYTPMDRWMRCHMVDGQLVIGPPVSVA